MRAGKLRYKVTFQRPVHSSGEATDNPEVWFSMKPVNADIRLVSGKEIKAGQGLVMQTDAAVEFRYTEELAAMDNQWRASSDQFSEDCRVITATNPDYQKRMIRVICRSQTLFDETVL